MSSVGSRATIVSRVVSARLRNSETSPQWSAETGGIVSGIHDAGQTDAERQAQGVLFSDDAPWLAEEIGYRGPTASNAAGITYRQLDYWARTGLVVPSLRGAKGSGSQRLYSFRDILVLKVVKRLLDTGVSLQQIRSAVEHLRERGVEDLAQITLMSDGASVYECTSADEVIDLVQGGQGVYGIAVGRVWREVEGTLAELPAEYLVEDAQHPRGVQSFPGDELSARREARRQSAS
ncbi:MerR family transcriptional regulator [Auritidibacter sp. NML120779]|nr:MerR family transcriptional regulator [Auritidibacter sp. NML120779]